MEHPGWMTKKLSDRIRFARSVFSVLPDPFCRITSRPRVSYVLLPSSTSYSPGNSLFLKKDHPAVDASL